MFSIKWLNNPKLNARCMELLLAQSTSAFISSGLGGVVLIVFFWRVSEPLASVLWLVAYSFVAAARIMLSRRYLSSPNKNRSDPKWLNAYGLCLLCSGAVWGVYLAYLSIFAEGIYAVVLLITFAAVLASGVSAYSISFPMYLVFSIPVLFPAITNLLLSDSSLDLVVALIVMSWFLFMVSTARRFSRFAMRSLGLEYKNDQLLAQLESQNERAERLAAELMVLSNTDALTGIHNRRYFDLEMKHEWHRGRRSKEMVSLILCDIDCFKKLNDSKGHEAGDKCLRRVARALENEVRNGTDFVARVGGEEFAVLMAETSLENAVLLAERLRQVVLELKIPNQDSYVSDIITMSFGVSSLSPSEGNKPEDLVRLADEQLYKAKSGGRNRVSYAS